MSDVKFNTELFRKRLRQSRLLANMTLGEVASRVGVDRSTLSKYESGSISNVEFTKVEALAAAVGVTAEYLLGTTDDPSQTQFDKEIYHALYDAPEDVALTDALGRNFVLLAYNQTVQLIVNELYHLSPEQRTIALKMIRALRT